VYGGAFFSPGGTYRYRLWREWGDPERRVTFVMLNPSTATADRDDPTIRKCVTLATRWGFGALDVVNLFAWSATRPAGLVHAGLRRAVGPRNDDELRAGIERAARIVLAWGSHRALRDAIVARAVAVRGVVFAHGEARDVGHLGCNEDGSPKHPLYLPYATRFIRIPWHELDAWPIGARNSAPWSGADRGPWTMGPVNPRPRIGP